MELARYTAWFKKSIEADVREVLDEGQVIVLK